MIIDSFNENWRELQQHLAEMETSHLRDFFASDSQRAENLSVSACGLNLDYSKNRITLKTRTLLMRLAESAQLEKKRDAMFAGDAINNTENRSVLHTALRQQDNKPVFVDGVDIVPQIKAVRLKVETVVNQVRNKDWLGYSGKCITDVLNLGIGGSFLGPKIVTTSLKPYVQGGPKQHFVANIDGNHLHDVLTTLNPETTLVLIASKSFNTQETLTNAESTRQWFYDYGVTFEQLSRHFIAISSNVNKAVAFGISSNNVFPMWDWVGGRYSLWSAIGMPIAMAIGNVGFTELLKGAADLDKHFNDAPLEQNLPVLMGMLGVWNHNFFDCQTHALLPYSHYLRGFPAYVQQMDMESNGKSCQLNNEMVSSTTGPVIWGAEGTNGQHAFHQLLHQGTSVVPVDFIQPLVADHDMDGHQDMLVANCFAQSKTLMQGKTYQQAYDELVASGMDGILAKVIAKHKEMPGNRPSNTLTFDRLTPYQLGTLIALYEHKVFVQGVIWNLNSFDQWGVELGKILGDDILARIDQPDNTELSDSSTELLLTQYRYANQSVI
ncbi:glucose-6-phosphate isomerase [Colwellia sp. 12G3]|uniref:glucose-6-phosphate isomerase n=1 Tax=Colwellia sp. 12G3 TaxID=2058299 RepID=UPI000C334060|nr:glucose-6-phosphate isomerase [Colwellia sp. 12G3]PKI17605.1 glucose-6-phosphate isomerase [Colwellia sp. 12G3]